MSKITKPYLIIISGPNGAGKTTFHSQIITHNPFLSNALYLNYDNEIARLKSMPEYSVHYNTIIENMHLRPIDTLWDIKKHIGALFNKPGAKHTSKSDTNNKKIEQLNKKVYRQAAENLRSQCQTALASKQNIIFETTSIGGQIKKMAQQHDYNIYGLHICVQRPEISVARVEHRVKKGGHDIPLNMIYKRYTDNLTTLPKALESEHTSIVIDNSTRKAFTPIFALSDNHITNFSQCPDYLISVHAKMQSQYPEKTVQHLLNLTEAPDIKKMPPEQRANFNQVIISNILSEINTQYIDAYFNSGCIKRIKAHILAKRNQTKQK